MFQRKGLYPISFVTWNEQIQIFCNNFLATTSVFTYPKREYRHEHF